MHPFFHGLLILAVAMRAAAGAPVAQAPGNEDPAIDLLKQAIAEQEKLKDRLGWTRSQNDLASAYLAAGRLADALAPLRLAYEAVEKEKILEPQVSIAANVRSTIEAIEKQDSPDDASVKWLWSLGEASAASDLPEVISCGRILRAALRAEGRRGTSATRLAAAERLRKASPKAQPPEARADLVLRAARVAANLGEGKKALAWLDRLDCGTGPASAYLSSTVHLVRALGAAAPLQEKTFLTEANETAAAFRTLGDRHARMQALDDLLSAANRVKLEKKVSKLVAERDRLLQEGEPGGLSGESNTGGGGAAFKDLGLHETVFAVSVHTGKVRVVDRLTGLQSNLDVRWQPLWINVNGLSMKVFGGWLAIQSMDYGSGAAASEGVPATLALEELGDYRPIPGKGSLLVLKNGAVRYE